MLDLDKNLQGQIVDRKFPLLRLLGSSNHGFVFLTESRQEPGKAAIKLIPVKSEHAAMQLADLEAATRLSHPHLIQLFEVGQFQLDDQTYLYAVMEYAEEDLSQILPTRPLTVAETREMLPPVLSALRYLHAAGFVHGHMKPSNIMAIGDQLKVSSDAVAGINQESRVLRSPSPYDPPETGAATSPAADVWALGVTLVEVLTQQPPVFDGAQELLLPESVAAPFSEIARQCLQRDPRRRWPVEEIEARLRPPASIQPARSAHPKQPSAFGKYGWVVAGVVLVLVLLALLASVAHRTPEKQKPSVAPPPTATPESVPAAPLPKPAGEIPQETQRPDATTSAVRPSQPEETNSPGGVLRKVLPAVPRSASNTIQGTIRVTIRVDIDSPGKVSNASFISAGPSKYFANLAMQSAKQWMFAPIQDETQNGLRQWILKFEFRRTGTRALASAVHGH